MNESFKISEFLKFILRDSIRRPSLAVKIKHATPMPTLQREREIHTHIYLYIYIEREREGE